MDKQIMWAGAVMDPSGYGEVSRSLLLGLQQHDDLIIQVRPRSFWHGDSLNLGDQIDTLTEMGNTQIDTTNPYVFIQHLTPENYAVGPGTKAYHVGVTTFETDSIPFHWRLQMRSMDELWTFSEWGKKVFEDAGLRRPVTVIPHGVDSEMFNPEGESLIDFPDVFAFGSNFDWTERKNPTALLQAYYQAFKPHDEVVLLLKTYYQFPIERSMQYMKGYINRVKSQLGLDSTPQVVIIDEILPTNVVAMFYRALDCYVLPSRGEGWSLSHSEAMATGLPAIAVNWSGPTAFMNDDNSYLVKKFVMTEINEVDAGPKKTYIGHRWADCDVDELASLMRHVFDHREEAAAKGKLAREDMVNKFSWKTSVDAAYQRLTEICETI